MSDEMDFHLIIGPLPGYELLPVEYGRYYGWYNVIAVDRWTGEEPVEFMADILSHEYIHHLLMHEFSLEAGLTLDNVRSHIQDFSMLGNGVI